MSVMAGSYAVSCGRYSSFCGLCRIRVLASDSLYTARDRTRMKRGHEALSRKALRCAACQNKVQHWQLRDLVAYDSDTQSLYTVCGGTVFSFSPKTKQVRPPACPHAPRPCQCPL